MPSRTLLRIGAACLFAFVLRASATAQPVTFDVTTSYGSDTLYAGVPASIVLSADATGQNVALFAFPLILHFSPSNLIGPIAEDANLIWGSGSDVFEYRLFNDNYGNGTNPDTLLLAFIDVDSEGATGPGELARIEFTPPGIGTITIDTIALPPANHLSAVDQDAQEMLAYGSNDGAWQGPYVIRVISVDNISPIITDCGSNLSPIPVIQGDLVTATIEANDPDSSSLGLEYFVAEISGSPNDAPNEAPEVSGGGFSWQTWVDNATDIGSWDFTIGVTDSLDTVFCQLHVDVLPDSAQPFHISMSHSFVPMDGDGTADVTLSQKSRLSVTGGFDLLISYDTTHLVLTDVTPGPALTDHGWEHFAYDTTHTPPGTVRIVAIADMNDGAHYPDSANPNGVVAQLHFSGLIDLSYPGPVIPLPLRFKWTDCGDNALSSRNGDTLFVASLDVGGILDSDSSQIMCTYPDPDGYNATIVCDSCNLDTTGIDGRATFADGMIYLYLPICDRGDVNLNGLAYEIADWVLYSNYLIYGQNALDPAYWEAQGDASDVNADGLQWTVWDHALLYLVIIGQEPPYANCWDDTATIPVTGSIGITTTPVGDTVVVAAANNQDIAELWMQLSYTGCDIETVIPSSRIVGDQFAYVADSGTLTVLAYEADLFGRPLAFTAGSGPIFNIVTSGGCDLDIQAVQAADQDAHIVEWVGYATSVTETIEPTAFSLYPNYPNPFNPTTTLAMDFPAATRYSLTIYNITGQAVRHFDGTAPAGRLEIEWDGRSDAGFAVGSGVYLYRLTAGDFQAVHKMLLLK